MIRYEPTNQDTLTLGTTLYNFNTNLEDRVIGIGKERVVTIEGRYFHHSAHALGGGWKAVTKVEELSLLEFSSDVFKVVNKYVSAGLTKLELVKQMQYILDSCKMS